LPGNDLTTHAEASLARAEWQRVLFAPIPRRLDILKLRPNWPLQRLRLRVHRNHGFEPIASILTNYLAFAGFELDAAYSAYDDSVSLATAGEADAEMIWLDYSRLAAIGEAEELASWMADRVAALRSSSRAPILLADAAGDVAGASEFNLQIRRLTADMPDVHVCDLSRVHADLGPAFFDERALAASGTRMSNVACVHAARLLGTRWLPAAVAPRIKALVLDLDNSLYEGVLGEDEPGGVRLTPAHAALQQRIVELSTQGMFIAICSRNEASDVEELFRVRRDFPLRAEHLSASEVSWAPKADGMRKIAESLRIGTDALLFLDDNPGELAAVASAVPDIHTLYAGPTAEDTVAALKWYPRLFRWREDEADTLRARDLRTSREREKLAAAIPDKAAYMRSLGVRLQFSRNIRLELERLASLSNKTNQFNLSMKRLSQADVLRFATEPGSSAVAIRLSDRLSDSGIIGVMLTRKEGDALLAEEFCISCRALGRDLEDVMALEAVKLAATGLGEIKHLKFRPFEGPRNQPARDWLDRFARGVHPDAGGWVTVEWNRTAADDLVASTPVIIEHLESRPMEEQA
jgi:FkbH-like protein